MKTLLTVISFALLLLMMPTFSAFAGPPTYNLILANPDDLTRADPWEEVTSGGNSMDNNHQTMVINTGLFFLDYAISTLKTFSINFKSQNAINAKNGVSKKNATKR